MVLVDPRKKQIAGLLPRGFSVEQDSDGDWLLVPPANVTIFSEPGEPWLVTDDYMGSSDWTDPEAVTAGCVQFLGANGYTKQVQL